MLEALQRFISSRLPKQQVIQGEQTKVIEKLTSQRNNPDMLESYNVTNKPLAIPIITWDLAINRSNQRTGLHEWNVKTIQLYLGIQIHKKIEYYDDDYLRFTREHDMHQRVLLIEYNSDNANSHMYDRIPIEYSNGIPPYIDTIINKLQTAAPDANTTQSEKIQLALITQWPLMTEEIYTENLKRIKERIQTRLSQLFEVHEQKKEGQVDEKTIPLRSIKLINYRPDNDVQYFFRKLADEPDESELYFISMMPKSISRSPALAKNSKADVFGQRELMEQPLLQADKNIAAHI